MKFQLIDLIFLTVKMSLQKALLSEVNIKYPLSYKIGSIGFKGFNTKFMTDSFNLKQWLDQSIVTSKKRKREYETSKEKFSSNNDNVQDLQKNVNNITKNIKKLEPTLKLFQNIYDNLERSNKASSALEWIPPLLINKPINQLTLQVLDEKLTNITMVKHNTAKNLEKIIKTSSGKEKMIAINKKKIVSKTYIPLQFIEKNYLKQLDSININTTVNDLSHLINKIKRERDLYRHLIHKEELDNGIGIETVGYVFEVNCTQLLKKIANKLGLHVGYIDSDKKTVLKKIDGIKEDIDGFLFSIQPDGVKIQYIFEYKNSNGRLIGDAIRFSKMIQQLKSFDGKIQMIFNNKTGVYEVKDDPIYVKYKDDIVNVNSKMETYMYCYDELSSFPDQPMITMTKESMTNIKDVMYIVGIGEDTYENLPSLDNNQVENLLDMYDGKNISHVQNLAKKYFEENILNYDKYIDLVTENIGLIRESHKKRFRDC